MAKRVDPDETAPSGTTLFAKVYALVCRAERILIWNGIHLVGNYLPKGHLLFLNGFKYNDFDILLVKLPPFAKYCQNLSGISIMYVKDNVFVGFSAFFKYKTLPFPLTLPQSFIVSRLSGERR